WGSMDSRPGDSWQCKAKSYPSMVRAARGETRGGGQPSGKALGEGSCRAALKSRTVALNIADQVFAKLIPDLHRMEIVGPLSAARHELPHSLNEVEVGTVRGQEVQGKVRG